MNRRSAKNQRDSQAKSRICQAFTLGSTIAFSIFISGCFQNLESSSNALLSTRGGRSGFIDTGGTPIDGSFDGRSINLNTQLGGIVGSFKAYGVPENASGPTGLMINLQPMILRSLGQATLNDLLESVDGDTSVQNIQVNLKIPQFGIQADFLFKTIAQNNNQLLRNILVIQPNLSSVDLGTGYVPEGASVRQIRDGDIITYGGNVNGQLISQISVFHKPIYQGSSPTTLFLPNASAPNWGRNKTEPFNGTVILRPVTPNIAKIFKKLRSSPSGDILGDYQSFASIDTTPSNFMLAVHKNSSGTIEKAWVFTTTFPNNAEPMADLLCGTDYNTTRVPVTDPNTGDLYTLASPKACSCDPVRDQHGADASGLGLSIIETCHKDTYSGNVPLPDPIDAFYTREKLPYIEEALDGIVQAPSSGSFPYQTVTSNGITVSPLSSF